MRLSRLGIVTAFLALTAALTAGAFPEIPRESVKALRITRGKSFFGGAVFVNGKYLAPPYVVERWGTGIRINKIQVSGQVVDWGDFLKTQPGAQSAAVSSAPAVAPEPAPKTVEEPPAPAAEENEDESSLDDLFGDEPKPKKKAAARKGRKPPVAKQAAKPQTSEPAVTSPDVEFSPNDASKALLKRINSMRTDIDRILRGGGFICFGDRYSQVTGDARTLSELLEKLPELQQGSPDFQSFYAGMRAAHFVYLNEGVCEDLFANRIDYRPLKELRAKLKQEKELNQVLRRRGSSTF